MALPVVSSVTPNSARVGDPPFTISVRGNNLTTDSVVSFGGAQLVTSFLSAGQVTAQVPNSAFATLSIGGLTVNVQNSQGVSNAQTFVVTAASPVTTAFLEDLVQSITVPSVPVPATTNPYRQRVDNVQVYMVRDGDTLQGIAARVAGDASKWDQIVALNNLRYPFISDDPRLLIGQPNYTLYLAQPVFAGSDRVVVNGIGPFIGPGAVLYFNLSNPLAGGAATITSDVVSIESVDTTSNTVFLAESLSNTYTAGVRVDVLTTSNNTISRVVAPGTFILVPSNQSNNSFVSSDSVGIDNLDNLLGADIALDASGFLQPDASGDLASFVGVPNLGQAINHRLRTERGELHYHPGYGNNLIAYLGNVNSEDMKTLGVYEIRRTLLADPRIKDVLSITSIVRGDTINVQATVEIDVLNTTARLNFVIQR